MGGASGAFPATRWTEIVEYAQTEDPTVRQAVVDQLAVRYWRPVYSYLRQKGNDVESAKDLTQGFFVEIVMGRDLVGKADPQKGRFRTYLLTALRHFAASEHRKQSARKRSPDGQLRALMPNGMSDNIELASGITPEQAFLRHWASSLLDEVLAEVEARCSQAGQTRHWAIFRAWVLRPIMDNDVQPAIEVLCRQFGVKDKKSAWNMVETVKRRFRRVLEETVRRQVRSDAEIEDEIHELGEILSEGGAEL